MKTIDVVGRVASAVVGLFLIGVGCGLTWWATIHSKDLNGVAVGGIFVVGVLLAVGGFLGQKPSSLAFNKDGVTLQLVADAVKDVKESAQQSATAVAKDPAVRQAVVGAKTEGDAERITASITQRIMQALPPTADLTRRALDTLTNK